MEDKKDFYEINGTMILAENEEEAKMVHRVTSDEILIKKARDEYVRTDLDSCGLSSRAVSCIKLLGVKTLEEFQGTTPEFYDRSKNPNVRNINQKTYDEIIAKLNQLKSGEN